MNSTFEKELEEKGYLVYYNVGDSMMPLIKEGRDLMVLTIPSRPPKKYDAVLYKRDNGQYVMHRILGEDENGFIMCGDNRYDKEFGIRENQILAILTSVSRNGKEIKNNSLKYKLYVHLWCDLFFIRKFILRVRNYYFKLKKGRKNAGK